MGITEKLLEANGWKRHRVYRDGSHRYVHFLNEAWWIDILFYKEHDDFEVTLRFELDEKWGYYLDLLNIRTMEQLSLLLALLGDQPTRDDLTIPAKLRPYLGAIDAAWKKQLGDAQNE